MHITPTELALKSLPAVQERITTLANEIVEAEQAETITERAYRDTSCRLSNLRMELHKAMTEASLMLQAFKPNG